MTASAATLRSISAPDGVPYPTPAATPNDDGSTKTEPLA